MTEKPTKKWHFCKTDTIKNRDGIYPFILFLLHRNRAAFAIKKPSSGRFFYMVRVTGIEPARSPART